MCGIAGLWRRDGGDADASLLAPMLAAMVHRGPDDSGVWSDGRVALGHQRLTILDLNARAHQPMLSGDGRGVLVYNGEVYNYAELRTELERDGAVFRTSGDTEVVLEALHRWGPERALLRFDGMFALAYLDRRDGALWLARDRLGIKPVAVIDTGTELVFASEYKALFTHPRVVKRLNPLVLIEGIVDTRRDPHRTLFEGVEGVQPGSWWKVTAAGIVKHQYFHALTAIDVDRLVAAGRADPTSFIEPMQAALQASVRRHLASDVPLAAMCSGGVDSSLITAYAKDDLPNLQGYVADTPWDGAEGAQAERVGRHLGVPIRRVMVDRERFLRLWPTAVWHSDAPLYHISDVAMLVVTQTCRADGIKVLLTGEGSDELFGGYPYYAHTYRRWRWFEGFWSRLIPKRIRESTQRRLAIAPFSLMTGSKESGLRRRLTLVFDGDTKFRPQLLMEKLAPVEPAADRAVLAHAINNLYDHLARILHRHDRMGMAASLESRVPFLANGMFDLAFHLPRSAKLQGGTAKWVVKKAAERRLPRDVVYAPKKGFPMPPFYSRGTPRLLQGGLLAQQLEWSAPTTARIVAMIDQEYELRSLLVSLELWLRLFFDGQQPDALGERLMALAA